ncbi:hypothetical protein BV25DRAFT_1707042 [Artomyces pyxidatus]|uniref:Uncharacterized protein n=1 Tax=Artomyces pyxidatus TaxID=48021 RepID=A0ACB8T9T0_9AGAM|nr:hypothetical protein BV25DRAFT_1707042 [Artomyces pyxidatus]
MSRSNSDPTKHYQCSSITPVSIHLSLSFHQYKPSFHSTTPNVSIVLRVSVIMQTDQPQARRVTARTIIFALSAATLVFLTTIIVVLITYTAISTPSTLDPSLSEFAICGPIVFWRVFWHIAWAANFVPISLDAMVHPCVPSPPSPIPRSPLTAEL